MRMILLSKFEISNINADLSISVAENRAVLVIRNPSEHAVGLWDLTTTLQESRLPSGQIRNDGNY